MDPDCNPFRIMNSKLRVSTNEERINKFKEMQKIEGHQTEAQDYLSAKVEGEMSQSPLRENLLKHDIKLSAEEIKIAMEASKGDKELHQEVFMLSQMQRQDSAQRKERLQNKRLSFREKMAPFHMKQTFPSKQYVPNKEYVVEQIMEHKEGSFDITVLRKFIEKQIDNDLEREKLQISLFRLNDQLKALGLSLNDVIQRQKEQ